MHRNQVILLVVLFVCIVVDVAPQVQSFRDHFIKKCNDYPRINPKLQSQLDCKRYADVFDAAMNSKDGAACQDGTFNAFINLTITPEMYGGRRITLWADGEARRKAEKLYDAGESFIPVNRVLAGYVMPNDICTGQMWNGYKGCKGCEKRAVKDNYWKTASRRFVSLASGQVNIILVANRKPLIKKDSALVTIEVPALRPSIVTAVQVYVPKKGQCDTDSSVQDLKKIIEEKSISYLCAASATANLDIRLLIPSLILTWYFFSDFVPYSL